MHVETRKKNLWVLAPVSGSLLYGLLYLVATFFYPGGAQFDKHSKGFSWIHNYWCNLLNEPAINGQHNPARPIALVALAVLCISLMIFWYIFPLYVQSGKAARLLIQTSGIAAMVTALFIFTAQHDLVINTAGLFGLVALTGTLTGLHKLGQIWLFRMGLFTIVLIAANNVLYYGNDLMYYLPVVQKITFFYFLLWICLICIGLYRRPEQP
ncbi:MAG: hypothetical protein INR73_27390 [Williamsia sp.]|nr:hypothetical protein [Williamsia sp.]